MKKLISHRDRENATRSAREDAVPEWGSTSPRSMRLPVLPAR